MPCQDVGMSHRLTIVGERSNINDGPTQLKRQQFPMMYNACICDVYIVISDSLQCNSLQRL